LGINAGNLVYYALSALGLLAVIAASGAAFAVLKWAGAAYLAWLGASAIYASFRTAETNPQAAPGAASFRDGLVVQLANPKALLYFLALLPQFIDPARPVAAQTAVLALIGCTVEMLVLGGYAAFAHLVRQRLAGEGVRRWVQRGTGAAFLGLAAFAAAWRRAG
jgi:homoserine/homoserine lactone efflux protein